MFTVGVPVDINCSLWDRTGVRENLNQDSSFLQYRLNLEGKKKHDQSDTGVFHLPRDVLNVIPLPRRQTFIYLLQASQSLRDGRPCCGQAVALCRC
jgi:hypothetical protein